MLFRSLYTASGTTLVGNTNQGLFEEGYFINVDQYFFTITYVGSTDDPTIRLLPSTLIPTNQNITPMYGSEWIRRDFYKNIQGGISLVPYISAPLDVLYYQDSSNPNKVGTIRLIESNVTNTLDVDSDILGKKTFTSSTGIVFTNGLKVVFQGDVVPELYKTGQYYVEGVGTAIQLIPVSELVAIESSSGSTYIPYDVLPYDVGAYDSGLYIPVVPDYITISRNSKDKNAWSRSNRWFHIDVINAVAKYNNYTIPLDQLQSAKRPIIEFNYDLQLVNSGRVYKQAIDVFDTVTTDALSNVEGTSSYTVDGIQLTDGVFVVFAADTDPDVSNKVYKVNKVDPSGDNSSITHLTLVEQDRKSTRLNSSHTDISRMPSSA